MSPSRQVSNQAGSAIVATLIMLGAITLIALSTVSMFRGERSSADRLNEHVSVTNLASNLTYLISNTNAWGFTQAATACNGTLSTSTTATTEAGTAPAQTANGTGTSSSASTQGGQPINCLYDADGTLLFDARTATNGFTSTGLPCNTFNSKSGNDQCPLRPQLTWLNSSVTVAFTYEASNAFTFNTQPYQFTVAR